MVIKGISERFHDAAVAVMESDTLLFASQSERFSRKKMTHIFVKSLEIYLAIKNTFMKIGN